MISCFREYGPSNVGYGAGETMTESRSDSMNFEALLDENRLVEASAAFKAQAVAADASVYERAERDPEAFWEAFARELEWSSPWTRVLDWKPPFAQWFVGGEINASVNCLDRHVR